MKPFVAALCTLLLLSSCSVSKNYNPGRKFGPDQLKKDFQLFRNILEESHPSLYWYTSKDSMDRYFQWGMDKLTDSMQEYQFRNILTYVTAAIRCGHTTVRASKPAVKFFSGIRSYTFPLGVKAWPDTALITSNINRRDSHVTRGGLLHAVEGKPMETILDSMFRHISADGYNLTHKYQSVSNGGVFRTMYVQYYGLRPRMNVEYTDTADIPRRAVIRVYDPSADTPMVRIPTPKISKRQRRKIMINAQRNLRFDTALQTAFLELNTFSNGYRIRSFIKRSFKKIRKEGATSLVVDMRGNGGGNVALSNLLTKYIAAEPFKIADSLYAVTNRSRYRKYQSKYFLNRLFFIFLTRKKQDGAYHFSMYENRYFKPKKKNHFNGTTYIMTGGNTFSAATLFTKSLKEQENVIVVGEETGGGAYGNTAWLIPEVTLPQTGVRFRLPLFRLVVDKNEQKGRGVMPEVEAPPTVDAIRRNSDYKIEKVLELIRQRRSMNAPE